MPRKLSVKEEYSLSASLLAFSGLMHASPIGDKRFYNLMPNMFMKRSIFFSILLSPTECPETCSITMVSLLAPNPNSQSNPPKISCAAGITSCIMAFCWRLGSSDDALHLATRPVSLSEEHWEGNYRCHSSGRPGDRTGAARNPERRSLGR